MTPNLNEYSQCANDAGSGYPLPDIGCHWINGNLNPSNSAYTEGDSTVQRAYLSDVIDGSHTITFQYDTTKAAILGFTRALAVEEAPHGIRVNAVCPAGTITPYHVRRAEARGMSEAELRALQAQINPHFLFNSLNTVADLIVRDPPRAEAMTLRLASVFRHVLAQPGRFTVELRATDEITGRKTAIGFPIQVVVSK